ncbi:hypothetical protein [Halomonas sp. MMSF_3323]|uniref:phage portal protein family protein n=1 Tax=Halomonas sp. MMSF_3323 TaxID=3046701 RepID=UPI00273DCE27|nr:hypothetical protein [Halomonas sp. MMSF_3323]
MANFRTLSTEQTRVADLTNEVIELSRKELSLDNAFKTFFEMEQSEPVLNAALMYLKSLLNRDFELVPHKDSTNFEKKVVQEINDSFDNLESYTKREFVGNILSFLSYGCALFECTYKREGGITSVKNLTPIRVQDVAKWSFDQGKLAKVKVNNPYDGSDIIESFNFEPVEVRGDKLAFFRLFPSTDRPLGCSLLQSAYVPYKSKSVISQYQLIGIAKSFGNTLLLKAPSEYLNSYLTNEGDADQAQYMQYLLESMELLHSGARSYAAMPSDVNHGGQSEFDISTISKIQANDYTADSTIERLNSEMLMSLMANILELGNGASGSYSLAEEKSNIVALFVKTIQATISDQLLKVIKKCFELNSLDYKHLPKIKFENVEDPDFETVSKYFNRLAMAGLITPDQNIESYLREVGNAPMADYSKALNTESSADPVERADEEKQL